MASPRGTGRELRFEINIYKTLEDRVTTLQRCLKNMALICKLSLWT